MVTLIFQRSGAKFRYSAFSSTVQSKALFSIQKIHAKSSSFEEKSKAFYIGDDEVEPTNFILLDDEKIIAFRFSSARFDIFGKHGEYIESVKIPRKEEGAINGEAFSNGRQVVIFDKNSADTCYLWDENINEYLNCSCSGEAGETLLQQGKNIVTDNLHKVFSFQSGESAFFKGYQYVIIGADSIKFPVISDGKELVYNFKLKENFKGGGLKKANSKFACILLRYNDVNAPRISSPRGMKSTGSRSIVEIISSSNSVIYSKVLSEMSGGNVIVNNNFAIYEIFGNENIISFKKIFSGFK